MSHDNRRVLLQRGTHSGSVVRVPRQTRGRDLELRRALPEVGSTPDAATVLVVREFNRTVRIHHVRTLPVRSREPLVVGAGIFVRHTHPVGIVGLSAQPRGARGDDALAGVRGCLDDIRRCRGGAVRTTAIKTATGPDHRDAERRNESEELPVHGTTSNSRRVIRPKEKLIVCCNPSPLRGGKEGSIDLPLNPLWSP